MRKVLLMAAILAMFMACFSGCKPKEVGTRTDPAPPVTVQEDSARLAVKIHFPSPPAHVRWLEVANGSAGRNDIGPTDSHLYALVEVGASSWPLWEKAFGAPIKQTPYILEPDIAKALLPPALLQTLKPDSSGILIGSPYYDPSPIASSWYTGYLAARIGDYVLMEFDSK